MSDIENEKNTTEPGEAVETDVDTAEQPEGSQRAEVAAAEPESVQEGAPAEPEAAAEPVPDAPAEEPAAEEPVAEAPAVEEPVAEAPAAEEAAAEATAPEEPAVEEPVAEAPEAAPAPAEAPAPPAEPGRRRSRKHVPRSLRRTRTTVQRERPATRKPIVRLEKPEHERGRRQERRGVVVSDAMDKTIVVKVESVRAHQRYKKVIRRSVKFHAHDEENQAHVGDLVRIVETRPLSKTKRWRLAEILEAAK
jgi:small subunit ribosomal protein S17